MSFERRSSSSATFKRIDVDEEVAKEILADLDGQLLYKEDALPSWAASVGYVPTDENEASHLVVGTGEILFEKFGAGVLAYCDNEFQAHRCLREIRKDSRSEAEVMLNSDELRMAVGETLQQLLNESPVT